MDIVVEVMFIEQVYGVRFQLAYPGCGGGWNPAHGPYILIGNILFDFWMHTTPVLYIFL